MIETVGWNDFLRQFRWNQGEHVAIIAPTGAGKTTLERQLMPYRGTNLVFGTKAADKQYDRMIRVDGFKRVESVKEIRPWHNNVLLQPKYNGSIPDLVLRQRAAFAEAMDMVVSQRRWTTWFDEAKYMSEFLKLRTQVTYCVEQLRSLEATIVCGAQRPAWLPASVLSNASHVFLSKTTNREDAQKLADVGGIDAREVRDTAVTLRPFEFLYIHTRGTEASILRTKVAGGR